MDMTANVIIIVIAAAATLYMLKRGTNVGLVMLLDSVFLVILARIPAADALKYAFYGVISINTVKLVFLLFFIMMLENIMRTSGMIKVMVENLKELVGSNRLAAGLLPMVLGLLPSPGGARFSCPMVEETTGNNTGELNKAFVNYWFRHIWLDGFILYPGVILAAELLGVSVINLFLHLIPFMLISILLGAVFGLLGIKKEVIIRTRPWTESFKAFSISMLPVIIVIIVYISLLNITGYSLEIAAGSMVMALFIIKRFGFKQVVRTMKDAFPVKLVIIIIGVMVFKEILFDSGLMEGLPGLMKTYNIPAGVLFLLLPFIGGFSSGITVSYVSMTFPVLIPLGLGKNLWFATLAFTAGTIGNMITPLHLCAVMTADYFKSSLSKLLVKVAVAEIALVVLISVLMGVV